MIISQTRKKAQDFLAGNGVDLDVDKAIHLLVQGANSGESACFYDLAETYFDGVPEDDPRKALEYLEAAGNTGHGRSCSLLARLYSNVSVFYSPEDLVKPNAEIAMSWCAKGAELEDPESMHKMATYFFSNGDTTRAEIMVKNALDKMERDQIEGYEEDELAELADQLKKMI